MFTHNLLLESKHDNILQTFENNKSSIWNSWLSIKNILPRPGKQGLVGLLNIDTDKTDEKQIIVFKLSQYIDYLVFHEYQILDSLKHITTYCPNFCKGIGMVYVQTEPGFYKNKNPFDLKSNYPIEKEMLLTTIIIMPPRLCD